MSTKIIDPRVPIASSVGRNTKSKLAAYLRWLLTALCKRDKLGAVDEGSSTANAELIAMGKCLSEFTDEAAVLKGESASVKSALERLNETKAEEPGAAPDPSFDKYAGTLIDTLHRLLFNLFIEEQTTDTELGAVPLSPASCDIVV